MNLQWTHDAKSVLRKWSTSLALISASTTAGLASFAILPERAQAGFPDWALTAMSVTAVLSALLIPLATSIQQRDIPKP